MSRSVGNTINLFDDAEAVRAKVMSMYTDPSRLRATDPGHVEGNPVFAYHDAFNPDTDEVADLKDRYVAGRVGDVEVKRRLVVALDSFLDPIRQRRRDLLAENPSIVEDVLRSGTSPRAERGRRDDRARSERRCTSTTLPRGRRAPRGLGSSLGPGRVGCRDRRLSPLPATRRMARTGRLREGRSLRRPRRTGVDPCPVSATPKRGCSSLDWRRPPMVGIGRVASSRAIDRATSWSPRSTPRASPTSQRQLGLEMVSS